MSRFPHVILALIPLLLTPLLVLALAEGVVDFGGGEKDVLLALPWLIWSIVFALCAFLLIYHRWPIARWTLRSALVATTVLFGLAIIAYAGSFLGVA
jgi:hypothetical protein